MQALSLLTRAEVTLKDPHPALPHSEVPLPPPPHPVSIQLASQLQELPVRQTSFKVFHELENFTLYLTMQFYCFDYTSQIAFKNDTCIGGMRHAL